MFCEHPTCSLEASTICKYHCHLSVCQQHRIEHENNLVNEFEIQLENLSNPISTLLNQHRSNSKDSDESRQRELDHINAIYDSHVASIDQRLKLSKSTNEFISKKREQLINYQNGDHQLTKQDYQEIQNLTKQIQQHLHQQYQLNNQLRDKNNPLIDSCSIHEESGNNLSTDMDCIEISDSEDEQQSQDSTDLTNIDEELFSPEKKKRRRRRSKQPKQNVSLTRTFCPLTQLGVFGLKTSHNLPRLCSKSSNKQRYLYLHLTHFHRLKSSLANQITKAVRDGLDPMQTKIFPQDNTKVTIENIPCPFDSTAMKFNQKNAIPNTPCTSSLNHHYFKNHLRTVHSISRVNADLIYRAMRNSGTISHVQFEEDLCEIK